jgi:hypothetical protein
VFLLLLEMEECGVSWGEGWWCCRRVDRVTFVFCCDDERWAWSEHLTRLNDSLNGWAFLGDTVKDPKVRVCGS